MTVAIKKKKDKETKKSAQIQSAKNPRGSGASHEHGIDLNDQWINPGIYDA